MIPARPLVILSLFAVLLVMADLLGPNPYVDPDRLALEIQIALGLTAIAMAVWASLSPEARREWRKRAILVTAALIVAVASTEAATRWVFRDVTTGADTRGYFSRRWAGAGNVLLNSDGFREREVGPKGEHAFRVAVVGDSFTFGSGLRPEQRYTDLMDAWLPDRIEVLNFGAAGANMPRHVATLERAVVPTQPDFVLLQWFVNDAEGNDLTARPSVRPLLPYPSAHTWLTAHSALYSVLDIRWIQAQVGLGLVQSYEHYMQQRFGDPNSFESQLHDRALRQFIETARASGVGVGIVLFPDSGPELGEAYPYRFLHERVLEICRQERVTCLDLLNDWSKVKDRRQLWVSPFDHHPSARANEIAAIRILDVFGKQWQGH